MKISRVIGPMLPTNLRRSPDDTADHLAAGDSVESSAEGA